MNSIVFKDPWILIMIPICLAIAYWFYISKKPPVVQFSNIQSLTKVKHSWKIFLSQNLYVFRFLVIALFLVALAGPQSVLSQVEVKSDGIDIVLALDASGSMAAEDFEIKRKRVNRLEISKEVIKDFIEGRTADRIGLVGFAGLAYTISPLTLDYDWLLTNLERVELGLIKEEGTAIGSALASAIGRLKVSDAKSKIIILLTDGVHNAGKMDPITAANIAKTLGIKIYTIGAGTTGIVPFPVQDAFGRTFYRNVRFDLDEKTLNEVANLTGGSYYRATNSESLRQIYKEIDLLEKTEFEQTGYKEFTPLFENILIMALLILLAELVLSNTLLMRIP